MSPGAPAVQVTTARLRLILFSPADAADMQAGRRQDRWHRDYPRQDDLDAAGFVRPDNPWGPRHVVLDQVAVGSIGFFGPPEDGEEQLMRTAVPGTRQVVRADVTKSSSTISAPRTKCCHVMPLVSDSCGSVRK